VEEKGGKRLSLKREEENAHPIERPTAKKGRGKESKPTRQGKKGGEGRGGGEREAI